MNRMMPNHRRRFDRVLDGDGHTVAVAAVDRRRTHRPAAHGAWPELAISAQRTGAIGLGLGCLLDRMRFILRMGAGGLPERDAQGQCLKLTDTCDRYCQRHCRTSGGPLLPLDF